MTSHGDTELNANAALDKVRDTKASRSASMPPYEDEEQGPNRMPQEPVGSVTRQDGRLESTQYRVLSRKAIFWWAALILAVGVSAAAWLLQAYGGDTPSGQLDAIRTAGTIVVGTGGAAALLLSARRQRSTEIALLQKDRDQADVARAFALQERVAADTKAHQERVASDARDDAAARRITELYTKAADQLGSDKGPVRLASLYALERLAQDNEEQRQTVVNLLCAYLRMPYVPSVERASSTDGDVATRDFASPHPLRVGNL